MSYFTREIDTEIVRLLRQSGVGLLPSDTIYGLSCRALDETAVKRIHQLKQRDKTKPFIVLISKPAQIEELGLISTDAARALKYWPGKLTVVCESRSAPDWLTVGSGSLAVRQPKDESLRDLIDKVGPIISTSANISGKVVVSTARQAQAVFGDKLDFYIERGRRVGPPSTIVKPVFGQLKIIRQGAVKIKAKDLVQ
jgi:L-threonylcarbamoyladenylate synthase